MEKSLLNFTKKTSVDLRPYVSKPLLLVHPFDKSISRIKHRTDYFRYTTSFPTLAQDLKGTRGQLTWAECCARRADDLLRMNRGTYVISYSGGIDSTALLVAILQSWSPADLKRVLISLSHDSIDENPSFFENYVSKFRLINSLKSLDQTLLTKDVLLVTGELGDQLFGSDLLVPAAEMFGDGIIHEPYQDAFARMLKAWSPPDEASAGALAEHFYPIVPECPFPIKTLHDFVWWYNFTQKWHHVKYRFYEMTTASLELRYGKHVLHFYDSPEFQRWSLDNHDLKIGKTMKSYKWTAKDYIHAFTKDPRQLELVKIQSLEKMYFLDTKRIAIDSKFAVVPSNEELLTYALL